jgi:hypothetical protein
MIIALPLVGMALSSCGITRTVGGWFGGDGDKQRPAAAPSAIDTNPGVRAEDMSDAEDRVPRGLIADTENVRHTEAAIPPQ